ncbi:unnamed protein product [Musa acuminata subsp. malaccensis]|uniref:(wild Malaysian banana) hypothetical protein n=1 Tax=Musa acuminata subsp. malaccensis TaxID=214687 RepID=A0A804IK37_MUSAM|nr:PREDICTED: uncharacterized protein LOC103980289 [Musa acuminata subsp. malaccensis]CAG1840951.1 unnamed protein product [Musa acuminata subsp. malaccensis]
MADASNFMTSFQILAKALKLLKLNLKPLLPIMLLSTILSSALLFDVRTHLSPLILDPFVMPFPMATSFEDYINFEFGATHDIKELLAITIFVLVEHTLYLPTITVTIYAVSAAYSTAAATHLTLSGVMRSLKACFITRLWVTMLELAFNLLIASVNMMSVGIWIFGIVLAVASVLQNYLRVVWVLALVVSVVEDYSGVAALRRALQLVRGNFAQTWRLSVFAFQTGIHFFVAHNLASSLLCRRPIVGVAMSVFSAVGVAFWVMLALAAEVVFYGECKKKRRGGEETAVKGGPGNDVDEEPSNTHEHQL